MKNLFLLIGFFAVVSSQLFAQTIAHSRAATFEKGINYAEFGNFWTGNSSNNYMDYLDLSILPYVKTQINLMSQMGFKTLRLPVCFSSWEDGIAPYNIQRPQYFAAVDSVIKWTGQENMNVLVDFHHGVLKDSNFTTELPRIRDLWTQVANRYPTTNPDKVFFEIYNEPNDISQTNWNNAAQQMVVLLRGILPNHTLIVSGCDWGGLYGLQNFPIMSDTNLIYSFHYYEPFLFTHQGASWAGVSVSTTNIPFPYNNAAMPPMNAALIGTWGEGAFNYYNVAGTCANLATDLTTAKNFSITNNVPVFCGEWGSYKDFAPTDSSRCNYVACLNSTLTTKQIPHAMWEWDGGFSFFDAAIPSYAALSTCMKSAMNINTLSSDSFESTINNFRIYPNPASDFIEISNSEKLSSISISNFLGQVVFASNSPQPKIDINSFSNGLYFIKCVDLENKTEVFKFLKV